MAAVAIVLFGRLSRLIELDGGSLIPQLLSLVMRVDDIHLLQFQWLEMNCGLVWSCGGGR